MTPLAAAKRECRARLKARLAKMTTEERERQSAVICERVVSLEAFETATGALLYRPLADEVDVTAVWRAARARGRAVFFPRIDGHGDMLRFVRVHESDRWQRSRFGFLQPESEDDLPPADAAAVIIVVPGLGFTRRGDRIGRGGGFYDRALSLPPIACQGQRVGVAFDEQIVDELPADARDVVMNLVVSSQGVWGPLPLRHGT
ncbi:MAG TPA: 5-formyltetrahydrofolate cyclo-ligase [Candidatus Binatia bacterium]|nr:5-formyltetrahydrofolate cyclo-ligase [Candidatus Binatia bacterium]